MANTTKRPSSLDGNQVLQHLYNDVDGSLSTNSFLVGQVGNKIALAISTTTVPDDTEIYTFSDSGTTLYVITVIYTDGSRETLLSVERTA